ncbi:MAG TPA: BREX-2 system adenine-specific DNA-methyltransferase PglX, partial [Polyangiaceae bacterium]|nr:BREX-2 system adenine-specific DNA-methyltransferase PglX [Polyangiaceae bacterium]
MAARKKKSKASELDAQADPQAPLAGEALLAAVKPLLKELAADLLKRADDSAAVTEALEARHAADKQAQRTGDAYPEWRRAFVEQVAASWLLSCVFVRTLEDRGLLGRNRIAGPGAEDSWKAFQQFAPSLSEREYLLTVFRELSRLPAAAELFDARHNPVWLLAPSAEGARKLLELFRSPTAEAPAFRFGGADTRFLGDLYQDLSEDVRKRYALLQTPRFVEKFILDRTLDPALERFGLDETTLIDPTCGSGHFLLGAFERLFDRRLQAEPGLTPRAAATKALDAIAGADINPYAVAIARFRLTLAFVEKCGMQRLKDAPRLPLHLAVADSLLYNPQLGQLALVEGTDPVAWEGAHFALEDPKAARDVLFKQYAAVVGNPPYITVKDAVLRDRYRAMYSAAYREYSLAVPFAQRFFQLGRDGASVGMITANSFTKREFGKRLIEEYLPTVNL